MGRGEGDAVPEKFMGGISQCCKGKWCWLSKFLEQFRASEALQGPRAPQHPISSIPPQTCRARPDTYIANGRGHQRPVSSAKPVLSTHCARSPPLPHDPPNSKRPPPPDCPLASGRLDRRIGYREKVINSRLSLWDGLLGSIVPRNPEKMKGWTDEVCRRREAIWSTRRK